jgi:uncharacterized repeat protein (TIGR02543 family)
MEKYHNYVIRNLKIPNYGCILKQGHNYVFNHYSYNWGFVMKKMMSKIAIIIVIFGLFASCEAPTEDTTKPDQGYTVRFEANGGNPAPNPQSIALGGKVVMPPAMTKMGYAFGGWYKEAELINQWNFDYDRVTGNITLYAMWYDTGSTYTVTFEANGGSPPPDPKFIFYNYLVAMPPAMTKTGYSFIGWYKEPACINQWNFDYDRVRSHITLYAKWFENFTVTFEANGGISQPELQSIAHGGKVVMPPVMTKTGYTFDSWYKEENCINRWNFAIDTVISDTTLYAKWLENFTIIFEANGGTPQPERQIVADGGKVVEPSAVSKTDFSLDGWYKEAACTNLWDFSTNIVTGNITLYAKWGPPVLVTGTSLAAKLAWLNTNARSGGIYLLEVTDFYEDLPPQTLSYSGKSNITIQLKGIGSARSVILSGSGLLFSIRSGVTLVLDDNVILSGTNNNTAPLVSVDMGGKLLMKQGSKISGNNSSSSYGGGVYVNGGEISGNTALPYNSNSYGGGVYVNGGTFTMNGGEISGNTAFSYNYTDNSYGGGVYVNGGTFTMNGGEISGNTASSYISNSNFYGGGVYVNGGTFTMNDGEISSNTASSGGGVCVDNDGTFTMSGGEISSNASSNGGGVYVDSNLVLGRGTFTMSGGEISSNTASSSSGGVYVYNDGTFDKIGGIITGYSSDTVKGNVVKNSYGVINNSGHAIYAGPKHKETTSGSTDNLFYLGRVTPPIWNGVWDY